MYQTGQCNLLSFKQPTCIPVTLKKSAQSPDGMESTKAHPLSAETSLMMRDCKLAWTQLRKLRGYLNDPRCPPSERALRTKQKHLLKDYLQGEMAELLFTSDKADGVNDLSAFVGDLTEMALDYLDRHQRNGTLTRHKGVIPEDEVWTKVGWDKGGSSFKMAFQIVNFEHPNSLRNTVVFAYFEA
ncbi:uncharacterized protein LOC110973260 [Acanthaster planci]|uniref:Uncharacterized protein LOC110973260 n=1 Tax=Acanthaster planci TaxID=133434 RepID=A0A8B7XFU6_ACAPL|nr:uncharacterized protein LOC110973260 [Acanthaster planci]